MTSFRIRTARSISPAGRPQADCRTRTHSQPSPPDQYPGRPASTLPGNFVRRLGRLLLTIAILALPGLAAAQASGDAGPKTLSPPPALAPFTILSRTPLGSSGTVLLVGSIDIKGNAESPIKGPLSLVIQNLPPTAVLVDSGGQTADGYPFVNLDANFTVRPFETQQVRLRIQVKLPLPAGDAMTLRTSLRPVVVPPDREKARLMGPDLDNDGVRDDLEPLLQTRYANDPRARQAAVQVLRAMRQTLGATTENREQAYAMALILNRSFDCMGEVLGDAGGKEIAMLRDQMMNSKERARAWIEAFNMLAGKSIEIGIKNPCDK